MASRYWTCRRCRSINQRVKAKCVTEGCSGRRPAPRRPKHQAVLETPYELWVELFGERCGICRRPPGPNRRLDRDHDHRSGEPRGLLCHRCNRVLLSWVTEEWLEAALAYLRQNELRRHPRELGGGASADAFAGCVRKASGM